MDKTLNKLRQQMRDLDERRDRGAIDKATHASQRAALERRIVDLLMAQPDAPAAADAAVAPPVAAKPRRAVVALLGVGVVVVAALGYVWVGNPALLSGNPEAAAQAQGGSGNAPHDTSAAQMAEMIDKLAQRLAAQPDDADGWSMLARSHAVIGQHDKAVPAFRKAAELRPDDAVLLADFADALAMAQGRNLAGEPMALVQRALKVDPNNLKALSLAGTAAFNGKDYAGAVRYWEKAREVGGPDSPFVKQVEGGIDEARQLAGMPPRAAAAVTATPAAALPTGARVSGVVSLAPALKAQASPQDTVLVYARPADGSRMPLAMMRAQVKDLPLRFSLDDSQSMSPAAKLSGHPTVIVAARVSKSGSAMAQPGDLLGQSSVVALGSEVKIEIADTIGR